MTPHTPKRALAQGLLTDVDLTALLGSVLRAGPEGLPPHPQQVQPASVDLRLGPVAHRVRAGFLPAKRLVSERLAELSLQQISLEGEGAVLERGLVYLIPLEEELELLPDLSARFNPRSSTGRCDLFTRVLCSGHPRFDEAPAGWSGRLWLEVCPLSFPVRLKRGDRLCQVRLQRGIAALTTAELRAEFERTPLVRLGEEDVAPDEVRFDDDGGILLSVGLEGRDPAGWRAARGRTADPVEFGTEGASLASDYFEAVHAPRGECLLSPGDFYVFASRERIVIPPHLAAEMLPVDVGIGELRNNYAGFFDSGFGYCDKGRGGTAAVLEVRAHDVPFLVEDGQAFFRLKWFRTAGTPENLYGEGRGGGRSYQGQGVALARCFR